ncbi:aldo/keto reductase [Mycena epipterygia]|nr:aldo/keto reductase [Mycena epipterygia]
MVVHVTHLGGTASNVAVGRVSHGLMMLTATPEPSPDEDCFAAIKAGVDTLPPGTKMFLNSGMCLFIETASCIFLIGFSIIREFYSLNWGTENLELLARFYAKYPDYAEKTFLSVKGGVRGREPDSSMENLRQNVLKIQKALGPHKEMDLYEPARIDRTIPIEQIMENLVVLRNEGYSTHIGLSECSADTLRRAHAASIPCNGCRDRSVWAYEAEQKKVIATARELSVSVIAYSPLGKGFLAGKLSSPADIPAGDYRIRLTRFKEDNMAHNTTIVSELSVLAAKKGVTLAQLSIAWVAALGPHVIPLLDLDPITYAGMLRRAARTLENCAAGDIELSAEDFAEITAIAEKGEVRGDGTAGGPEVEHLWG